MFLHRDTAAPEAKIVYYPSQVAFTKAPSKAQLFFFKFKLPIFTGIQYQVPSGYIYFKLAKTFPNGTKQQFIS